MKSPHRDSGRGDVVRRHAEQQNPTPKPATRQAKWQSRNPKARWAHMALASALKRGLITKGACAECGAENVDGHHPDYDRPMAVIWLCRRHHIAEHRRTGRK